MVEYTHNEAKIYGPQKAPPVMSGTLPMTTVLCQSNSSTPAGPHHACGYACPFVKMRWVYEGSYVREFPFVKKWVCEGVGRLCQGISLVRGGEGDYNYVRGFPFVKRWVCEGVGRLCQGISLVKGGEIMSGDFPSSRVGV